MARIDGNTFKWAFLDDRDGHTPSLHYVDLHENERILSGTHYAILVDSPFRPTAKTKNFVIGDDYAWD